LREQLADGGVSGYLTKYLLGHPQRIVHFATRLPFGLVYALSPRSGKNAKKRPGYPRELTTVERKGMLYGPLTYLRSRRHARRIAERFGPLDIERGVPATRVAVSQNV
jgi:hypothetical protein